VNDKYILTPRNGSIGETLYIEGKSFPSDHMFIIKDTEENIKYIFYIILYFSDLSIYAKGTTIKGITKENLSNIIIPIPSIEIQNEIVNKCDYYSDLIIKLQNENNNLINNNIIENFLIN
jgi:type I restriction enzyme S subunit